MHYIQTEVIQDLTQTVIHLNHGSSVTLSTIQLDKHSPQPMPRVPRINYQKLNSTGERVPVIEDQLSTQLQNLSINDSLASIEMSTPSGDAIDLMVMSQTVMHIIDEYPINNMGLDQVNVVVDKLEKLRMDILKAQMRVNISKEELPEDCKLSINQSLLSIKEFMKAAADIKEKLYLRSQKLHVDEAIKLSLIHI